MNDEPIECAFCYGKFASFKELAIHVNDYHTSPTAREERLEREAWHPLDDEMESENMLPQPGSGKNRQQPDSGGRRKSTITVPFLTVEDIPKGAPFRTKILAVITKDTGFNDVIVKISFEGKRFFWGLKASNPAYEKLFDGLGADENKWVGQEFMLGLEFSDLYEKNYAAALEVPAPEEKKKK